MRILLVDLPTVLPLAVIRPRIQPPLWAAYLTSYLKSGIAVDYLDARAEDGARWIEGPTWRVWGLPIPDLVERIIAMSPDVICIHVGVSTELGIADNLIRALKARMRLRVRILLGGPGVALVQDEFLPESIRECEVCRTVGFGKPLNCDLFVPNPRLNKIPRREIWWAKYQKKYDNNDNYHSGPGLVRHSLQIETSVGCGAACEFCATRGSLQRRSLKSVVTELVLLKRNGIRGIQFEDDNILAWTNQQVLESLPYLQTPVILGFEAVEFPNGATVRGMLNAHFLKWLEETLGRGVRVKLSLPFESAADGVLRAVFKPHRREHCDALVQKLLPLTHKYPGLLVVEVFLQVGFHIINRDGALRMEGWKTMWQTLWWARKLSRQGFEVNCWFNSPIPGTPLFAPWRHMFPNADWERLLFSLPSLFYPKPFRKPLLVAVRMVNTASRAAAFRARR